MLSALAAAAERGHLAVARALLAAGADVDLGTLADAPHRRPLYQAAIRGHVELARLLLSAGQQWTPLIIVVSLRSWQPQAKSAPLLCKRCWVHAPAWRQLTR